MALKPNLPRVIRAPGVKSLPALKKAGYKRAGPKHGKNVWALPKAAGPAAPTPALSPYEQAYNQTAPWAVPLLEQLDTDQAQHQSYVSDQVAPWLAKSLAALTGVDPSAPGYNPTIQQQYLSNIQGPVGNAMNAAAAAQPAAVAPTTPGGATAAPNAYMGAAMSQYAAQRGGADLMMAQAQSVLNTVQANTFAQGALRTMADYAAGLPATYVTKRNELRSKIDQWVAEQEMETAKFEETMRHNRVQEATSATNAETNAAIALANLGLKADDQAADNAPDMGPIPVGYTRTPDGRYVRDPSYVPPPGAGGGSASQKYTKNWFLEKGWKKVPAKAGPATKKNAITAKDGSGLWLKPASGGGSSSSTKRRTPTDLGEELSEFYLGPDRDGYGGWSAETKDPKQIGSRAIRWVLDNKAGFMGANRAVNQQALKTVLQRLPQEIRDHVVDILDRGYISNGRWRAT